MSIEFTAVSLQRDVFKQHSKTSKLEALWKLGPYTTEFFDDPQAALVEAKTAFERMQTYIENYAQFIADVDALAQNMELPTLYLSMGTDWKALEEHFAKATAKKPILKKAFHGSKPTPYKVECSYGAIDFIEGAELKELAAAIKSAGKPDEQFEQVYEDLLDFYQEAVENDDVVLRGLE